MDTIHLFFNPGCALSLYKPEAERRIFGYQQANAPHLMLHKACCRHHPGLDRGTIINVCAGCDRRFRSMYDGIDTISLWEVLDRLDNFPFPDYGGATMSVHDPCPVRGRPDVHTAVRNILRKMNIRIVEVAASGSKSICCGDTFYGLIPEDKIHGLMRKRAQSMPCEDVVVYCVSCVKAMHIGGKRARHLIDLLLGEDTEPQEYRTRVWHEQLEAYIGDH